MRALRLKEDVKQQQAVSNSTPESEIAAAAYALRNFCQPAMALAERSWRDGTPPPNKFHYYTLFLPTGFFHSVFLFFHFISHFFSRNIFFLRLLDFSSQGYLGW